MLVLVLAALLQPTPPAPALRTLGKGPMSAIDEPRQVTVRSAAEWAALWKENGASEPVPAVDFSREMVVGVFLGSRPTAGYGVEIVRAVGNNGRADRRVRGNRAVTRRDHGADSDCAVSPRRHSEARRNGHVQESR